MSNPFLVDFDTLLTEILTSYKNLDSSPDVSQGSITFIKGACLASMLYGLYRYQDFISNEVFPDTASSNGLSHWGAIYGIPRLTTDTDTDYLNKILTFLRQPSSGGTALDYYNWTLASVTVDTGLQANPPENFNPSAVDVGANTLTITQNWYDGDDVRFTSTGVLPDPLVAGTDYYVLNPGGTTVIQVSGSPGGSPIDITDQGSGIHTMTSQDADLYYIDSCVVITPMSASPSSPGTVNIVFEASKVGVVGSQFANPKYPQIESTLADAAFDYVEVRRPVTANANTFDGANEWPNAISVTVTPLTCDTATMETDIASYVNSLNPGDTLYKSQISAICLRDGAVNATVNTPANDVAVANTYINTASSIVVTATN